MERGAAEIFFAGGFALKAQIGRKIRKNKRIRTAMRVTFFKVRVV
jgi:hypothetical protein